MCLHFLLEFVILLEGFGACCAALLQNRGEMCFPLPLILILRLTLITRITLIARML